MAAPDMDVIKEIPGYKVIMKAILKMQIQQLVEQLASHTDEESVILTASVSDGTLSHLGSDSGKNFLEDHEDIKSQFLGFCLKRHHKKKQQEKERESLTSPPKMGGPPPMRFQGSPRYGNPRMPIRSPHYSGAPGVHPVSLSRASQGAQMRSPRPRHEPYPMNRPPRRPSFNLDQPGPSSSAMKLPLGNKIDNQIIKIEPDDDNTNGSDSNTPKPADTNTPSSSQPSSPAVKNSETPQPTEKDDEATNSSTSTIPNEPSDLKFSDTAPAEGLSLDSDFSNLISSELNVPGTPDSQNKSGAEEPKGDIDPDVNVKVEAITESEMELEITGVELGHGSGGDPMASQESWAPPPGGAAGTMADMPLPGAAGQLGYRDVADMQTEADGTNEGYNGEDESGVDWTIMDKIVQSYAGTPCTLKSNPSALGLLKHRCLICGKNCGSPAKLKIHERLHTGEKPFECEFCNKCFSNKSNMYQHIRNRHDRNYDPRS